MIEALACGRPVVAPRLGQLVDLVAHGKAGLLYQPDDTQDCRQAIVRLLDAPELPAAMAREARASVAGRGWVRIVKRVTALAHAARIGVAT